MALYSTQPFVPASPSPDVFDTSHVIQSRVSSPFLSAVEEYPVLWRVSSVFIHSPAEDVGLGEPFFLYPPRFSSRNPRH